VINSSPPIGIYIHIPFCLSKCYYCDFYSLPLLDPIILEQYTLSIISELKLRKAENYGPFASIYLGGGTPSLLRPTQVERILESVFANYRPYGEPEISMEVNPATVNLQDLKDLRSIGINRLSIGVQSFSDAELKTLGRIHSGPEASEILGDVKKAGFDNFNIDLIYGLPCQTLSGWQENLRLAVDFNPQHISAYLLQLDESTPLARRINEGTISLLDDELEASMYYATLDYLKGQGYSHYEISNFARPNYECCHNKIYWQCREYLGIGAGAVSFNGTQRILNKPPVETYIEELLADRPASIEILEDMDYRHKVADAIIMGLRLAKGINREEFCHRFGIDILEDYHDVIQACRMQGLLEIKNDYIYLTKKAYFLSNQVLSKFIA